MSTDFFELKFSELLDHFNKRLKPYTIQVSKDLGLNQLFDELEIEIISDNNFKFTFHMLEGIKSNFLEPALQIPEYLFCDLIFINFAKFLRVDEFIIYITSETLNFNSLCFLEKLKLLCEAWYKVSYQASELFFADEQNLQLYFSENKFVNLWQNETTANRHQIYFENLSNKIKAKNKVVLDVGSGFGRMQKLYAESKTIINIDISEAMIEKARELSSLSSVIYYKADINKLPFTNKYFDLVFALQIMMHLQNPFNTLKYLSTLLNQNGEIWTDFTCNENLTKQSFYQESFMSKIYSEKYVIDSCLNANFSVEHIIRIPDKHDNYWLILNLQRK
ncbi:MAG: class I SAM-dependent methyltransferase [Nostoc sp.]|uniref:class I SAM-dependent methyltransferase n=1 Tax=Nostoc sp. TaxID=1180 RepID=UPI002FF93B37